MNKYNPCSPESTRSHLNQHSQHSQAIRFVYSHGNVGILVWIVMHYMQLWMIGRICQDPIKKSKTGCVNSQKNQLCDFTESCYKWTIILFVRVILHCIFILKQKWVKKPNICMRNWTKQHLWHNTNSGYLLRSLYWKNNTTRLLCTP